MEVTHLLVVYLLVGFSTQLVHERNAERNVEKNAEAEGVTETPITEDQQKVYDECRNPDYKKYVKCLMRPKRHGHHTSHGDGPPETGRSPIAITIEINTGIRVPARKPSLKHTYYATAAVARSLREIDPMY